MNKNEARVTGDTGLTGRGWIPEYETSFPRPASSHCRTDSTVGAKRAPGQSELASGPSEDLELPLAAEQETNPETRPAADNPGTCSPTEFYFLWCC